MHTRSHPFRRCLTSVVFLGTLFTLLSTGASAQSRDVSLDELTNTSTEVVVGAVTEKRSVWAADRKRIFTEVRLRVDQQLKGTTSEETVVLVPGGQIGNVLYEVSDMPVFIEGEEVLVFLWRAPSGQHLVTGAAQGKLRVVKDEAGNRVLEPGAERLFRRADQQSTAQRNGGLAGVQIRLDDALRAVRDVKKQ